MQFIIVYFIFVLISYYFMAPFQRARFKIVVQVVLLSSIFLFFHSVIYIYIYININIYMSWNLSVFFVYSPLYLFPFSLQFVSFSPGVCLVCAR